MKIFFWIFSCLFVGVGDMAFAVVPENERVPLDVYAYDNIFVKNKVVAVLDETIDLESSENVFKKLLDASTVGDKRGILFIANFLFGTIAVIWLLVLGGNFVIAQGNEEKTENYKQRFGWIALGLGVISVASYVGYDVFDPGSDVLNGGSAGKFDDKVQQVISYFKILVVGVAVAAGVLSGFKLIMEGNEEETVSHEKKFIQAFLWGAGLILLSDVLVRIISLTNESRGAVGPVESINLGISEMVGLINFVLSFVASAAVFMLVLASLYYVTSFGNEEQTGRAKHMIIACVIGIVVCLSSYIFVNFLVQNPKG